MNNAILIIDNDKAFTTELSEYLSAEGFSPSSVHDGETGLKRALNKPYCAIILDIVLPKMSGYDVIKGLREHIETPVLMLTARHDEIDKLVSFELGVDDFLTKPTNPSDVIARLRAIVRRAQKAPVHKPVISHDGIVLDCTKHQASLNGTVLDLTKAEFNILEMLLKAPGQAYSKEELTENALGREFTAYDRSIDVHISNLRNKLGTNDKGEDWVKTVRGFGYSLNV